MLHAVVGALLLATAVSADYGSSGCGGAGVLTAESGFVKSHSAYSTIKYSNNKDCSWNIDAPAGQRVRLEFVDSISIEDHNNCEYDYLTIYDGQDWYARKIGTWCGTGAIPTILSSGRYLYIEFVTDNTGRDDGFKLRYEFFRPAQYTGCYTDEFDCSNKRCVPLSWSCDSEDDCGDNSDERNCTASTAPPCKTDEFLCDDGECIIDRWQCDGDSDCRDGSDELSCMSKKCSSSEFDCGQGDCIDSSWVCDGQADCTDKSDEDDCSSGSCGAYQFRCKVDKCIPESFVCDSDNDCGDNSDEQNCNTTSTVPPPSTRAPVVTTESLGDSGCGGPSNLTGSGGQFTTSNYPSFYSKNSVCTWTITVKANERIELQFTDFKLEAGSLEAGGSRSCQYDSVSIYDPKISLHSLVGRYCGESPPAQLVSAHNTLAVQFTSDDIINKKGFTATWKAVAVAGEQTDKEPSSGCFGPRDLTSDSGIILSHEAYGNAAYPESVCVWVIAPSPGTQATLTFNTFDLETSESCKYDALKVYLGSSEQSELAGTFCGSTLPDDITSTSGFYLVFRADDLANGDGFNISYSRYKRAVTTTQKPAGDISTLSQEQTTPSSAVADDGCYSPSSINTERDIQSLNYGETDVYPKNLNCKWLITAPKGKVVRITFSDFNVEYEVSCGYDDLSVYEGTSSKDPLIKRVCGDTLPKPISSDSNVVFVQFLTDDDTGHDGFRASVTFVDPPVECKAGQMKCSNEKCVASKYQCDGKDDCGDNSDELACFTGVNTCGTPSPSHPTRPGNTRVVGGTEANAHSWPWQAYIVYNYFFVCGGSLIHPQWVITAAHCFENKVKTGSRWQVTLGKHKKSYESEAVKAKAAKIFEYPHYDETTTDSDLALIKLEKPIKLNDLIKPICLPPKHREDNTQCYVTGWGDTKGTGYASVLKQAAVPIINRGTCNSQQWLAGDITNNMFCAGYPNGGHDGCSGDSGGPLACEDNGKYYLQGITSWGVGCGLPKMPGVYTMVPNFVDWIKETIENNS